MNVVESLGQQAIVFLFLSLVFVILLLCGLLWLGWWVGQKRGSVSPYSKQPMMLGVDLPVSFARQVEEFLKSLPQPENPPFDCTKAAICRQTGRIFPDAVKRGEIIRLGWDFLQNRYPGNWVSWGSLGSTKAAIIRMHHRSMHGFQTEVSCPAARPEAIDQTYAYTKPGPLYVDPTTKMLLGWQIVPGTYFEVLVVKRPDFESIDEIL